MKEFHTVEHNTVPCNDVKFHKRCCVMVTKIQMVTAVITIYKLINFSLATTNYDDG